MKLAIILYMHFFADFFVTKAATRLCHFASQRKPIEKSKLHDHFIYSEAIILYQYFSLANHLIKPNSESYVYKLPIRFISKSSGVL